MFINSFNVQCNLLTRKDWCKPIKNKLKWGYSMGNKKANFEKIAVDLRPTLKRTIYSPKKIIKTVPNPEIIHNWEVKELEDANDLKEKSFDKGDSFTVDFKEHLVGYLSMKIKPLDSPPDAPLHLKLTFGEMPVEVSKSLSEYNGWISSSWLQEEIIHIDVLPNSITIPRRYSFRYLKIEILDTSKKYRVSFEELYCDAVTSGDVNNVTPLDNKDKNLQEIDKISIKTLQDCMQEVFEDGPKRDRRLWLGDLRLQALANYETIKNNDLVKRCLYLFAAVPNEKGMVPATLFVEPTLTPDDTYLLDYSLFFTTSLYDYYTVTNDKNTLFDLWPTALRQIELAIERLSTSNILIDDDTWWSFIDWNDNLNKQASTQAILIYALKKAKSLAEEVKSESLKFIENNIEKITQATIKYLWDDKIKFFVSGQHRQISWSSQIWMTIAGVFDKKSSQELMIRLFKEKPVIELNTPYMYHHLVEALLLVGAKEKAITILKQYWGGMVLEGANTFWELYNPKDNTFSPYGDYLINSYCHAWSCTPTYLIRKYNL